MQPPMPSLTPTWHNNIYPAIDYANATVSHEGETVVITGAPPSSSVDVAGYWTAYEVNVKSTILLAKHLFPTAAKGASVVTVPAGAVAFPAAMTAGLSGFLVSKLALIKTVEYLAVENPDLNVTAMHPGMVDTAIFRGSGATPDSPMVHMDTPQLFAGFCLWVSRPAAKFLSGNMVWANWDVEELKGED